MLDATDCTVTTVDRGADALDRLDDRGFDCVVSEYRLPERNGLWLLRSVRERRPTLPFVLFTAYGDERVASEAIDLDVSGYVDRDAADAGERLASSVVSATRGTTGDGGPVSKPTSERIVRAVDEAPIGITISDPSLPDNPLVYVNDAYERLTGYSRESVIGRNCRLLQGPESDPETVAEMREAIDAEEPVTVELVNYREDGTPFWNRVDISPIHDEDGEVMHYVGFQTDVSKRKRAEENAKRRAEALQEERRTLDRVLSRVNELFDDVVRALVEASDRDEIEHRVAAETAAADGYRAAWIGETLSTQDTVRIGAAAGDADGLSSGDGPSIDVSSGPIRRAIDIGQVETFGTGEVTSSIDPERFDATVGAVVPLTDERIVYGVLCAYTAESGILDSRECAVLGSIGRMVANAINAVETRRALTGDRVTEIGFEVRDTEAPLLRLSEALDRRISCTDATVHQGAVRLYLAVEDAPVDLESTVAALPFVEDVLSITTRDDVTTFSVTLDDASPFDELAESGAAIQSIEASDGRAIVRLTVAPARSARTVASVLEESYDAVDLLFQRERDRQALPTAEFVDAVRGTLTDRQFAVLELAYRSGYFERPRPVSGDDLAASMSISRQTFHQHLRIAERKLLESFFD